MGFRFRKSVNFGPLRLNFSKSGMGYSVGGKGFRITKKATGGTRTTASIPGTGISYVKEYPKTGNTSSPKIIETHSTSHSAPPPKPPRKKKIGKILGWIFTVLCLLWAILSLPHIASLLFLLCAALAIPIEKVRALYRRLPSAARITLTIVVFIAACAFYPTTEQADISEGDFSSSVGTALPSPETTSGSDSVTSSSDASSSVASSSDTTGSVASSSAAASSVASSSAAASPVSQDQTDLSDQQAVLPEDPVKESDVTSQDASQDSYESSIAPTEEASEPAQEPASSSTNTEEIPADSEQQTSRKIYITPTGKRYHYDSSCNGGTYIESTLEEALARGLTPCQKCAGG